MCFSLTIFVEVLFNEVCSLTQRCMKSIWNGVTVFGLVNIPVKLYAATKSSAIDPDKLC